MSEKFDSFESLDLINAPKNLESLLANNVKTLETMIADKNHTYESFVAKKDLLDEELTRFFTPVAILQYTKNSDATQEAYSQMLPMLTEYSTKISQDERIYQIYKTILNNESDLTDAQKMVLKQAILDFELEGAGLEKSKKDRIKEINIALSELDNQFSQNLLDATKKYKLLLTDPKDVEGIPASELEQLKVEGGWQLSLLPHIFQAYMSYGTNRSIRETLYKEYVTRAPENEALIEQILQLRDEKAKILGIANYAELSVKTKMAPSAKAVEKFVLDLIEKSRGVAEKELEELKKFARSDGFNEELNSYDTAFYSKKLERSKFDLDEEEYKPYFEATSVTEGLFSFLTKLFGVEFKKVEAKVWDKSVVAYDLARSGTTFARLYADLYAREEKRGGAWMDNWQTRMRSNANTTLASAYIACNFPPPTANQPSLLKHDDVVTLFHEMGHAIHHLFSQVDERPVSGIGGVEWDAVEFPSQWLENFAYEKEVLKIFAKHYKSGEVLPDEMIDKLVAAKNFLSAMALLRQSEFALFDILIHQGVKSSKEVQEILDEVRKKTSLIKPPSYNKFQNGFSHIFSGGYAAGYYSYKWAEVLSADAFYAFVDNGIFNIETSKRFLKEVLSAGGSRTANENFVAFMKREPDNNALLRLSGIAV